MEGPVIWHPVFQVLVWEGYGAPSISGDCDGWRGYGAPSISDDYNEGWGYMAPSISKMV